MGLYLSHMGNDKTNLTKGTRPDENFARELIQLFAIGLYELNVDGSANRDNNINTYPDAGDTLVPTYTQEDVQELAKVMTGWDLKNNRFYGDTYIRAGEYASAMDFVAEPHEDEIAEGGDGNVTIFGETFALNSGADGSGLDAVLDLLLAHSNMGPFISKHLITQLVTSNPSSAYIARVTSVFNNNGVGVKGDLKAVIKAILTDVEARDNAQLNVANFGKLKEPILAWTQLLRSFNVSPLDEWTGPRENGFTAKVYGVYAYKTPQAEFGQAPFRAKHVFNFYSPDFVPSNTYFFNNRLVAPESQIQTDQALVRLNNTISNFIQTHEVNKITKLDNRTLANFAATKPGFAPHLMLINFDRELGIFEQALDGDTNGDFTNMDAISFKEKAVDSLLDHLNKIMLGNTMSLEYRSNLQQYLLNATGLESSNNFREAHNIIRDAVRFITTSSAFMVQK